MRDKTTSLEQAAGMIEDGMTVGLGGSTLRRHPMALIREIARQGRRNLTLQAWLAGIDADILIAAGCVDRLETAYLGLGPLGGSPNAVRAVRDGKLELKFFSESSMIARFRAAADNLPFAVTRALNGTDLVNTDLVARLDNPFDTTPIHAVAAARPDVAIFHGYAADDAGNVRVPARRNRDDIDVIVAGAANTVIVTVEKIVSRESVKRHPQGTYIPGNWVDAVIEVPFGAHPGTCDTVYRSDFTALDAYLEAAQDAEAMQRWLKEFVYEPEDHPEYLRLAATLTRLAELSYPEEVL